MKKGDPHTYRDKSTPYLLVFRGEPEESFTKVGLKRTLKFLTNFNFILMQLMVMNNSSQCSRTLESDAEIFTDLVCYYKEQGKSSNVCNKISKGFGRDGRPLIFALFLVNCGPCTETLNKYKFRSGILSV